jgi:glycine/D-amino acid oxidase-like deaminating enzyme
VLDLVLQENKITGVTTKTNTYTGKNTVVCAGGLSRSLLQPVGVTVNNYFTHAQLIMTPPVDLELATVVMPAQQQRLILEAQSTTLDPENQSAKLILDPGAVQFMDGSLCIGQISAIADNPQAKFDLAIAEAQIRQRVGNVLPLLEDIPGTCHSCLVAFNNQGIALVGNVANITGLYLFSGFTSTLVYAPILARRFAQSQAGGVDRIIEQLQLTLNRSL